MTFYRCPGGGGRGGVLMFLLEKFSVSSDLRQAALFHQCYWLVSFTPNVNSADLILSTLNETRPQQFGNTLISFLAQQSLNIHYIANGDFLRDKVPELLKIWFSATSLTLLTHVWILDERVLGLFEGEAQCRQSPGGPGLVSLAVQIQSNQRRTVEHWEPHKPHIPWLFSSSAQKTQESSIFLSEGGVLESESAFKPAWQQVTHACLWLNSAMATPLLHHQPPSMSDDRYESRKWMWRLRQIVTSLSQSIFAASVREAFDRFTLELRWFSRWDRMFRSLPIRHINPVRLR